MKFANIEEDTPSYHRSYDFFVSRFSEMCHSEHEDLDIQNKSVSLRVSSVISAFIPAVISSKLHSLHSRFIFKTTGRCIFVVKFNVCVCLGFVCRGFVVCRAWSGRRWTTSCRWTFGSRVTWSRSSPLCWSTCSGTHKPTGTHTLNRHCTAIKTLACSPILSNIYGGLTTWRWV